jgi:hypothetical protein
MSTYTANGRGDIVKSKEIVQSYSDNDSNDVEKNHKDHEHGRGDRNDTSMIGACD